MNSSKEDLLEMSQLTSPMKKLPRLKLKKRNNQVHSPPCASPARSSDRDVTSLFSVKKISTETISDLTDDDLSSENLSKSGSSSIKSNDKKVSKLKRSLVKIKQESGQVDAKIKSIRSKLQLEPKRNERPEFSFFGSGETEDQKQDDPDELLQFLLPENLQFNLNLAQSDSLSIPNRQNFPQKLEVTMIRSLKPDLEVSIGDCTTYYPPYQFTDMEEVVVMKNNILELSISHLKFSHHPLFSLEHVLQEKLRQMYEKYSRTIEGKTLERLKETMTKKSRENLFKEGKIQRARLKGILNVWRAIKKLRSSQNYSSTNARLIIKKETLEVAKELEKYEDFFGKMLQSVLEEHRAAYKKKLKEYNKKTKSSDDDSEKDIEKPTFDFNKTKAEAELRMKFEESFKPPHEPELLLYLKEDHQVTNQIDNNEQESDRRKVMSSTKFTVKVVSNGITVCKTKPVTLSDDFSLDINEMFSIQWTDVPKFLTLEVFEHPKGLLKKKIAELKIEIPHVTTAYNEAEYNESNFERREIVHYKHAGVGSGYKLSKMLEENDVSLDFPLNTSSELNTKGTLVYRIGWRTSQLKSTAGQGESASLDVSNLINRWGTIDENQLRIWPKDENKLELDQQWTEEENQHFRLNPLLAETVTFCRMGDIENNIRLQYLKLRDQNEIEFDGVPIPNRIREIPFGLLRDFKKRKTLEAIQNEEFELEDPESLRDTGKRRLRQIHARIFHVCKGLSNNLSYESVVNEKYLVYFEEVLKTSLKNLVNWFRWQPKLTKPLPRAIKKSEQPQITDKLPKAQNKIIIEVLSAKNIPERKRDDKSAAEETRPFLEISYEDFFTKTSVATGANPAWNEFVELPLGFHHADYLNPNALSGAISVNVFDHVPTGTGDDDLEEKFWLGEVKIPLSALTRGLNLSGWFKVIKPSMLFGYETKESYAATRSPKHVTNQETSSNETYIQLDLRISPNIPSLEPNMADLPSNDIAYIKDRVIKWNNVFNATFPSKKFNALAVDTNGKTNCITRFIRHLEPPQLNNDEFDVTPEQCLRYVSLIPFTHCNHFYQNVWLTSDQLLNFMIGSVLDHCIALTCFLLALNMDVYLLLGYGIPNGSTSYVLLREYTRESDIPSYFILDVVYNEKFSLTDPFCPLQRVYCIANGENVWGNAQRTQNPAFLRFDLSRKSDWWPLFHNDVLAPTNFVNNKINFALTRNFEEIERQLERKLRRKFSKWRPMERTNFNHRVSDVIKNSLRLFEMNAMYAKSKTEALIEVNKATSQFMVNGLIINLPFTSIHAIAKKIKCTNVHIQEKGVTEFGLSVFIQSYPGQVLSVWIFIGTVFDNFSL